MWIMELKDIQKLFKILLFWNITVLCSYCCNETTMVKNTWEGKDLFQPTILRSHSITEGSQDKKSWQESRGTNWSRSHKRNAAYWLTQPAVFYSSGPSTQLWYHLHWAGPFPSKLVISWENANMIAYRQSRRRHFLKWRCLYSEKYNLCQVDRK